MDRSAREAQWTMLMRAALRGDDGAYRRLLESLAAGLRPQLRLRLVRFGCGDIDAEDVVQETLLAIHLKRHTWTRGEALAPWVAAIARNKLIDVLRRRGRRAELPLDDFVEGLADDAAGPDEDGRDVQSLLAGLGERQRHIVRSISIEGRSVRETAEALGISEGAVRVALHRSLKALAALYRGVAR